MRAFYITVQSGRHINGFMCSALVDAHDECFDLAAGDAWDFGKDRFSPRNTAEAAKNVYMELTKTA